MANQKIVPVGELKNFTAFWNGKIHFYAFGVPTFIQSHLGMKDLDKIAEGAFSAETVVLDFLHKHAGYRLSDIKLIGIETDKNRYVLRNKVGH